MSAGRIPTTANSPLTTKGDLFTYSTSPARLAVGANGEQIVADSSQTVGLRYNPQNSKANCFINGGMDIWQRSTSASATQGYVAADRWITYTGTSGRTYSRQTGTAGIPYALRCQRDSGQTTTNGITIGNAVEIADATPYQGKTVTISFYARAGANYSRSGSTLGYAVTTGTGTTEANGILSGYTGQSTATSGTVTLTTSFQRFAFSFTFGASITQFNIELSTNTLTGTAGANDWFEVTGVQMDLGTYTADTAPTFRRAGGTIQGELAACQRYYYVLADSTTQSFGTCAYFTATDVLGTVFHPVTMRTSPTFSAAAGSYYEVVRNGAADGLTGLQANFLNTRNANIFADTGNGASGTAGHGGQYRTTSASANIAFSAEL